MMRHGSGLVEVLVLGLVLAVALISGLSLASRNHATARDLADRVIVQALCLDALERFKRYKPIWGLPGEPATAEHPAGPPLSEAYLPVEIRPGRATAFDLEYAGVAASLGASLSPRIERVRDPSAPGLFRIDVTQSWVGRDGRRRDVTYSRYCFAP